MSSDFLGFGVQAAAKAPTPAKPNGSERRKELADLFARMDADGNGLLDIAEFRGIFTIEVTAVICRLAPGLI